MPSNNNFMKKRIDDAAFNRWLFEKVNEKSINSALACSLAEEYKRKYEHLLKEYLNSLNDTAIRPESSWAEKIMENI